jgi:hypothetical protein
MLKTMGTISISNQRRVHRLGACADNRYSTLRCLRDNLTHLFQKRQCDTSAKKLGEMVDRELAQVLKNMLFDIVSIFLTVSSYRDNGGGEISAVYGVMDRDRDLISTPIIDDAASNASPHRLQGSREMDVNDLNKKDLRWLARPQPE